MLKTMIALAVGLFFVNGPAFGQAASSWPCADDFLKSVGDNGRVRVSMGVSNGLVEKKVLPDVSDLEHSKTKSNVAVRVLIGKDGAVHCAEAVEGDSGLWARSVEAAKQWRFRPYLLNGQPVAVETRVEFAFKKSSVSALPDGR